LLGYTETDYNLSAMIRYNLITLESAKQQLLKSRREIVEGKEDVFKLMEQLEVGHLIPSMNSFFMSSPFL